MLLLDTCTLLWLAADRKKLSDRAAELIGSHPGALFLSAISAFEIGVKHRKGGLELPMGAPEWIELALAHHGVTEVAVDCAIAAASTELPALHADPCDRIIVATALLRNLTILSPDPLLGQYPDVRTAW